MTIRQDGKVLKINKDGSFDKRYKEGRKEETKRIFVRNKYKNINEQVNKKIAQKVRAKKHYNFMRWVVFILGIMTALVLFGSYKLSTVKDERTMITPVIEVIAYADEIKEPEPMTLEDQICQYDWNCEDAKAIVSCESSWNENALAFEPNGTVSVGLFQINSIHFERFGGIKNILNNNIEVAHKIYEGRGNNFSAWSCARILGIN